VNGEHVQRVVADMIQPYLDQEGFELVEVEYVMEGGNRFLRVYVDKEGGIDIDECGKISEYFSEQLDRNDPIPEAYILEISSPGAERPLLKNEDYRRAVGKDVYITTNELIDGKKEFEGLLESYDESVVVLKVGKKGKFYTIRMNQVSSARLTILF
jgi:ribosome maturation factor RimP